MLSLVDGDAPVIELSPRRAGERRVIADGLPADLNTLTESRPPSGVVKRVFDLCVAGLGLIVLSPVMALLAVAVKSTSRGPVLYGSKRLGHDGGQFKAWKFRSMHVDADDRLAQILSAEPAARAEYELYRKLERDPRVTPLGGVMRQLSLDELPQLVNIVCGEMSVVGPRPKLPNEQPAYGEQLEEVLAVRPGLTGLWQVSGRNKVTLEQRVRLDVEYVRSRTFIGDLAICAKTALQLLRPGVNGAC